MSAPAIAELRAARAVVEAARRIKLVCRADSAFSRIGLLELEAAIATYDATLTPAEPAPPTDLERLEWLDDLPGGEAVGLALDAIPGLINEVKCGRAIRASCQVARLTAGPLPQILEMACETYDKHVNGWV